MSVTFTFYNKGENFIGTSCSHECSTEGGCEEHRLYHYCDHMFEASNACAECALEVNVSNTNAAAVLDRLGVEFDYCGTMEADDLLGRALVANVGRDDSGVPSVEDTGRNGATIIECGLRAGYFDGTMGRLVALANAAAERGHGIGWA